MKYLNTFKQKIYEGFNEESYYEFDAVTFYTNFIHIYYEEKQSHPDYSDSIFFDLLTSLNYDVENTPRQTLAELIIKNILKDKKVDFYDRDGKNVKGEVEYITFYYSDFFKKFRYEINLYNISEGCNVDQTIPVKIYDKQIEIEKYIDIYFNQIKFNL